MIRRGAWVRLILVLRRGYVSLGDAQDPDHQRQLLAREHPTEAGSRGAFLGYVPGHTQDPFQSHEGFGRGREAGGRSAWAHVRREPERLHLVRVVGTPRGGESTRNFCFDSPMEYNGVQGETGFV